MCAALTDDDMLNRCSTNWAFLTGSSVDPEVILEIAATIYPVEGGAIAPDALIQHPVNRFVQRGCLFCRHTVRRSQRMQFCHMQGLIGIDVAQSGNERLIEQQWLELSSLLVQRGVQPLYGELGAQGFWSQPAEHVVRCCCKPDATKLARIIEDQFLVAGQTNYKPVVQLRPAPAVPDEQVAAHAQMDEQAEIGELENAILCPPADIDHFLSLDLLLELSRRREGQRARPEQVSGQDCPPNQIWL